MPQLLNAQRFLLLIPLSLKSYLFHMHNPLPTLPHPLPYHFFSSAREIHLFKDLFSVNQQPICLAPKKKKMFLSKIWSLSVLSTENEHPSPTLLTHRPPFSIIPCVRQRNSLLQLCFLSLPNLGFVPRPLNFTPPETQVFEEWGWALPGIL